MNFLMSTFTSAVLSWSLRGGLRPSARACGRVSALGRGIGWLKQGLARTNLRMAEVGVEGGDRDHVRLHLERQLAGHVGRDDAIVVDVLHPVDDVAQRLQRRHQDPHLGQKPTCNLSSAWRRNERKEKRGGVVVDAPQDREGEVPGTGPAARPIGA